MAKMDGSRVTTDASLPGTVLSLCLFPWKLVNNALFCSKLLQFG